MKKQNIGTPLLLLLWVAMFCFFVTVAPPKEPAAKRFNSLFAAQNQDQLSSEEQSTSVAWIEPTSTHAFSGTVVSAIQFYTPQLWVLQSPDIYYSPKPFKAIRAFASIIIRFKIFPNAP